jgi:hypothetical protein
MLKHQLRSTDTIKTYTPQPSTPIKHAGSEFWCFDGRGQNGREVRLSV